MVQWSATIINPSGLHFRPAGDLAKTASMYEASITFRQKNSQSVANAKSVIGVLAACVKQGDTIEFTIDGEDEQQALEAIQELVNSNFGESNQE